MYSVTSSQTFKEVPNLYDHLRRVKDDKEFPFVLVGTKCDLENDREVPKDQGEELARKLGVKFLETSAKTKVE
jgi:GTPase KRas protein